MLCATAHVPRPDRCQPASKYLTPKRTTLWGSGQHYYSIPYRYAREQVDVRATINTVEIFHRGQRIAAHGKSTCSRFHTTIDTHMPPEHQTVVKGRDPQLLSDWAADIGPHTAAVIQHPQQGYHLPGRAAPRQGLTARPA
ncbi:Mu transposase domain-containing protein [Paraburkholderia caffeinilytica]|uniref:Mu transposase domain-containing protein n=1 Tax=Paraburkholderia caffeinilytica TaxID=1761016 RepID=UPI003DA15D9D